MIDTGDNIVFVNNSLFVTRIKIIKMRFNIIICILHYRFDINLIKTVISYIDNETCYIKCTLLLNLFYIRI